MSILVRTVGTPFMQPLLLLFLLHLSVCLSVCLCYVYILIFEECVRSWLPCSNDLLLSKFVQHLLVLLSSEKEASRAYIWAMSVCTKHEASANYDMMPLCVIIPTPAVTPYRLRRAVYHNLLFHPLHIGISFLLFIFLGTPVCVCVCV